MRQRSIASITSLGLAAMAWLACGNEAPSNDGRTPGTSGATDAAVDGRNVRADSDAAASGSTADGTSDGSGGGDVRDASHVDADAPTNGEDDGAPTGDGSGPPADDFELLRGARLVDEIDPCAVAPVYESAAGASVSGTALGQCARLMPPSGAPKVMAYRIGVGKGLVAGHAYVLDVEYPDDVSRGFFMANRGADFLRGWATGKAIGDSMIQFVNSTPESLDYPQTSTWQHYRQLFVLSERFQGVLGVREAKEGTNPFPHTPQDGFHVAFFQVPRNYDLRSEGVAVGRIRLYEIPDIKALRSTPEVPPSPLPRRHVFWREEMADMHVGGKNANERGVSKPIEWFRSKMRLAQVLGIDTFGKDLLEFGYNQGWASGDISWFNEAQPPNTDLWADIVAAATAEGMPLMPYYEYKGSIGYSEPNTSFAYQRRAHKLYHGIHQSCDDASAKNYTCTWWVEDHNADLTDPDTLIDLKKVIDKTITRFKGQASFVGAWFRMRQNHLPMSFAPAAIARYRADRAGDALAQTAVDPAALRASYEGDKRLYRSYVNWWFGKRRDFLVAVQKYVASVSDNPSAQVLFTPWITEQVPELGVRLVTDDPAFFSAWVTAEPETTRERWFWQPTSFADTAKSGAYGASLTREEDIAKAWRHVEEFHAAPYADPANYADVDDVMMTYPIGRLTTLANPDVVTPFRAKSGLTAVHHYTLNEDNSQRGAGATDVPFKGEMGYVSVDVDRAGPHLMIHEARALAVGDARNIGILSGSSFSCGYPERMRAFFRAYLALPALPSTVVAGASTDAEVVVREIKTPSLGTYYAVINTSLRSKTVKITFPQSGATRDLGRGRPVAAGVIDLTLESAELRAYRVGP